MNTKKTKKNTNVTITVNTLTYEINSALADMDAEAANAHKVREKKPNIFKRFWNWITRKK